MTVLDRSDALVELMFELQRHNEAGSDPMQQPAAWPLVGQRRPSTRRSRLPRMPNPMPSVLRLRKLRHQTPRGRRRLGGHHPHPKEGAVTIPLQRPNPGPQIAFDCGLPYLTVDEHGATRLSRNADEHAANTEQENHPAMTQISRSDLEGMSPQQIVDAYEGDQCAELLGADSDHAALLNRAHDPNATLTAADMKSLRAAGRDDLIDLADREGRLDHLMSKES